MNYENKLFIYFNLILNKYPSLSYGYFLMKTLNYPLNNKSDHNTTDYLMFQKTVLKINIHYSSLLYEYMKESPMILFRCWLHIWTILWYEKKLTIFLNDGIYEMK